MSVVGEDCSATTPMRFTGALPPGALPITSGSTCPRTIMTAASKLAAAWIDGFLCGNETEAQEIFGDRIHAFDDETDWRWRRWRESLRTFRETGVWDGRPWFLLRPFANETDLPDFVWTVRGEEVRCWSSANWKPAIPQPPMIAGEFLAGTRCAERAEHAYGSFVDDRHTVCAGCGRATE